MSLERLWAGWRSEYIETTAGSTESCVFCNILSSGESDETLYVVRREADCLAILNVYPYTNGHMMVMPTRHVGELEDVTPEEAADLWALLASSVRALKADLVLEAVARQEGIKVVPDELSQRVAELAQAVGREPKEVAQQLERSGAVVQLAGDIIRSKALDLLVEHAEVVEVDQPLKEATEPTETESAAEPFEDQGEPRQ